MKGSMTAPPENEYIFWRYAKNHYVLKRVLGVLKSSFFL